MIIFMILMHETFGISMLPRPPLLDDLMKQNDGEPSQTNENKTVKREVQNETTQVPPPTSGKPYNLTQAKTQTQFQRVGKMSAQVAPAHVLFSFPVSQTFEAYDRVMELCKSVRILDLQRKDKIGRSRFGQKQIHILDRECQFTIAEMDRVKRDIVTLFQEREANAPGERGSRNKRFLGILTTLIVGAIGLYSASQLWQMKSDFETGRDTKKIFTILKDNYVKIGTNQEKIDILNGTLSLLVKRVGSIQMDMELREQLEEMRRHLHEEARHFRAITTAVMNLVNGVITPSVISTDLMLQAKEELTQKASKQGYVIPFKHLMEYYQLPHNVLVVDNVLTIFLHVPLVSSKGLLDLYSMIPTVMRMNDRVSGLIFEKQLIGVTQDQASFRITNREELSQCVLMGMQYYYCPTTLLYRNFDTYCISAVYKSHWSTANQICELMILPETTWADQISEQEFLLFHNKSEMIEIDCEGDRFSENIKGPYYFETTDVSCKVTSDDYEFETMPTMEIRLPRISRVTAWNNETLLKNVEPSFVQEMLQQLRTAEPTKMEEFYKTYKIDQNFDHNIGQWAAFIPGYLAIILVIVFICTVFFMLRKKNRKRERTSINVHTSYQESPEHTRTTKKTKEALVSKTEPPVVWEDIPLGPRERREQEIPVSSLIVPSLGQMGRRLMGLEN